MTGSAVPFAPEDQAAAFKTKVMGIVAARVVTANLPDDMQIDAVQILSDLEDGLANCQEIVQVIWQYKVCSSFQLGMAMRRVTALEAMAAARTSTLAPQ